MINMEYPYIEGNSLCDGQKHIIIPTKIYQIENYDIYYMKYLDINKKKYCFTILNKTLDGELEKIPLLDYKSLSTMINKKEIELKKLSNNDVNILFNKYKSNSSMFIKAQNPVKDFTTYIRYITEPRVNFSINGGNNPPKPPSLNINGGNNPPPSNINGGNNPPPLPPTPPTPTPLDSPIPMAYDVVKTNNDEINVFLYIDDKFDVYYDKNQFNHTIEKQYKKIDENDYSIFARGSVIEWYKKDSNTLANEGEMFLSLLKLMKYQVDCNDNKSGFRVLPNDTDNSKKLYINSNYEAFVKMEDQYNKADRDVIIHYIGWGGIKWYSKETDELASLDSIGRIMNFYDIYSRSSNKYMFYEDRCEVKEKFNNGIEENYGYYRHK